MLAEALSWNASELKQLRVLEISSCLSMPIREDLYSGMEDHLSLLHTPYAGSIADACLKLNIVVRCCSAGFVRCYMLYFWHLVLYTPDIQVYVS